MLEMSDMIVLNNAWNETAAPKVLDVILFKTILRVGNATNQEIG